MNTNKHEFVNDIYGKALLDYYRNPKSQELIVHSDIAETEPYPISWFFREENEFPQLEKVALEDEYFKERNLYPNVDFYSGIIYRAIGIPTEMFTVMFALGRLPGWIAQWEEMMDNGEPIGRPRQIYTGATERDYVNIANR